MKYTFEADLARSHPPHARNILDALGDLVPDAEELVRGRILRSFDRVVLQHQRVQLDDLAMTV